MTPQPRTEGEAPVRQDSGASNGAVAAPGESILGTTAGDRCSVCGSELAPDQAYCVDCGTRRGRPRFTLSEARAAAAAASPPGAAAPTRAAAGTGRGWWASSASGTLVAGVAVLLIAMGVGFEIGHSGERAAAGQTRVVLDGGDSRGGAGSSGTTGTSGTGGSGKHHASSSSSGTPKKPITSSKALNKAISKKPSAATIKQENQKTDQILHTKKNVKIAPSTTQVGGKCTKGTAGCQNGKLTGNVFGNT